MLAAISVAGCSSAVSSLPPAPTPTALTFRSYEAAVLPVLSESVSTFRRATRIVTRDNDLNSLPDTCQAYREPFDALRIQFDSIPRVGPWYTRSGVLHRRAMGLYHQILGSIDECQLAADTGNRHSAAVMKRDMARISRSMAETRTSVARQIRSAG